MVISFNMATPEMNPLVEALSPYVQKMSELNQRYFKRLFGEDDTFIRAHYGFLVDAFSGLEIQYLEPANIVTVLPWIMEITSPGVEEERNTNMMIYTNYLRKALVKVAASYYAIHGLVGDQWTRLPRYYFENGKFPTEVCEDQGGVETFNGRVEDYRRKVAIALRREDGSLGPWHSRVVADFLANGCINCIYPPQAQE